MELHPQMASTDLHLFSLYRYDWARTFRLALFNGGFMAPLGHHYYGALDRKVFPLMPTSPKAVASKVAIDQLLFAPVCTVFFYAYKCFMEGRSDDLIPELKQKWAPTLLAGYKLWPAVSSSITLSQNCPQLINHQSIIPHPPLHSYRPMSSISCLYQLNNVYYTLM